MNYLQGDNPDVQNNWKFCIHNSIANHFGEDGIGQQQLGQLVNAIADELVNNNWIMCNRTFARTTQYNKVARFRQAHPAKITQE